MIIDACVPGDWMVLSFHRVWDFGGLDNGVGDHSLFRGRRVALTSLGVVGAVRDVGAFDCRVAALRDHIGDKVGRLGHV